MVQKQDLKCFSEKELRDWMEENSFQSFRGQQIFNWIYKNGVDDFGKMKNLPGDLIKQLKEKSHITCLQRVDKNKADDGTAKYLWQLADGHTVESVYLPYAKKKRHSVCISSQVGCALGCVFCATGLKGLVRDLTPGEIVDQVLKIQQDISVEKFGTPRLTNVVFMGMGEPLANLTSVLAAISILNDSSGLDIGMRKITISTVGLIPGIERLASHNSQVGLAVSLNAPNDKLRSKIMPVNDHYPLSELIDTIRGYINKTGRRVTFAYVLIKDINDSPELAYQLVSLINDINCHVNLIPFNPVTKFEYKRPSAKKINIFKNILEKQGIQTTFRQERGTSINAACGQLRRLNSRGGD